MDDAVHPHFAQTEQLMQSGRFLDALREAQVARGILSQQVNPPGPLAAEAHYWLGRCYAALSDKNLASRHLDSALTYIGASDSLLRYSIELQSGAIKLEERRIRSAIQYFETLPGKNERMTAEARLALGMYYLTKSDPTKAWSELQRSLAIFQELGQESSSEGKCFEYMGYHQWKFGKQYNQAYKNFKNAESIYLQNGGEKSNYIGSLYINMGGCRDEMGFPREAVGLYQIAAENLQAQNTRHPSLPSLYNNLGNSLGDLGDFSAAISYLEKAVELASPEQKGRYWNNLGDVYADQGNSAMAEKCFVNSIQLLSNAKPPQPFQLARPYHNLAIIYRQRGQLDSALACEFRSLPLRKYNPNAFLDIARTYQGIGECYLEQGTFTNALHFLDSALWLQRRAISSGLNAEIATACLSKARCMAGLGHFELAMALTDSALFACGYTGKGQFAEVIAPQELLLGLGQKGNLLYQQYRRTQNEILLSAAEKAFDTAAQAIRFFRNTLLESQSRAVFAGQHRSILSGGMEAALAMHRLRPENPAHLQRAFAFSEQSKALVLLEGVRSAGAVKFEGISDSLLECERALRQAIADAEVGLHKILSRGNSGGDSLVVKAKNEVFVRQRAFEGFQHSLASGDFVNYYNFRYDLSLVTPEEIQADLLAPNRTLVSYFVGEKGEITAFVVRKNGFEVVECPGGENLEKLVTELREGLFGYHTLPLRKRSEPLYEKTLKQYVASAQALYVALLAPVEHLLGSEVVIVPDGVLGYVPFELLLTGPPLHLTDFTEYPYWFKVKNRAVSYAYSATLLREMTQKQHRKKTERPLLAMAPFFPGSKSDLKNTPSLATQDENRKNFKPLVYSGQEVRDISAICKSADWWVGKEAGKQVFMRYASDCQMLHLSTHGVLDSAADFSYLAFSAPDDEQQPEQLFIRDLYGLQLNADLVTLSACETGVGQLQAGEGVISLARAFAYAGAKSIVTSLWQVNDLATKDLMILFYRNLKSGKNKDLALRDAKLEYLESHAGERAHPFFWAGMVGVGAMQQPVRIK